jgi:O-antigen ligase
MTQSSRSHVRPWIYRVLVYGAFITATFTIAGSEACFILMFATALSDPSLWGWIRQGQSPAELPYGRANPPAWTWIPFAALVGIAILAAVVNPDTLGTFDDMRYHYRIFLPFVLLLALPTVDLRRAFTVFAVFAGLLSIYGAIQYRFGVDWFRPEGHKIIRVYDPGQGVYHAIGEFTHHITYGGVMLMIAIFLIAVGTGRGSASPKVRGVWVGGGALAALATVLSLARSAWLGMLIGLLLLVLIRLPRRLSLTVGILAALAIGGYVGLVLSGDWLQEHFLHPDTPAIVQRLVRTSPQRDVDRVRMWQSGWLAVQDRPWLGVGMGRSGVVLPPYRQVIIDHYHYQYNLEAGEGLHDIYLQVAFDIGFVGLAAYLACWGAIFVWSGTSLRKLGGDTASGRWPEADLYRAILQGAIPALAGSMVAGLFENNAYDKEVQGVILLLMGLALYAGLRIRERPR